MLSAPLLPPPPWSTQPIVASVAELKEPPAVRAPASPLPLFTIHEALSPPPGPPLEGFSVLQPSGAKESLEHAAAFARRSVRDSLARSKDALYPDVLTCLGFREPTASRELARHAGFTLSHTPAASYRRAGPSRPLWRKRETVVHERIVQYTTVDADGMVQELVESERSQNEIVHLECKETGEFAHRESSEYEQCETFNSEIVAAERGNEEYLHLKSRDDEYEHLESNVSTFSP